MGEYVGFSYRQNCQAAPEFTVSKSLGSLAFAGASFGFIAPAGRCYVNRAFLVGKIPKNAWISSTPSHILHGSCGTEQWVQV